MILYIIYNSDLIDTASGINELTLAFVQWGAKLLQCLTPNHGMKCPAINCGNFALLWWEQTLWWCGWCGLPVVYQYLLEAHIPPASSLWASLVIHSGLQSRPELIPTLASRPQSFINHHKVTEAPHKRRMKSKWSGKMVESKLECEESNESEIEMNRVRNYYT